MKDSKQILKEFMSFLEMSTSPYLSTIGIEQYLEEGGFVKKNWGQPWVLERGDKFFVNMGNGTLLAFTIGKYFQQDSSIIMSGCHTDFPCLRLKYQPQYSQGQYELLNVEGYGGGIWHSYLDRPLSVSGKVVLRRGESLEEEYIDIMEPILVIPSLAIHFNREVNEKNPLTLQKDMQPILTLDGSLSFEELLAEKCGVTKEDICAYDLYVYYTEGSVLVGAKEELLLAPRLDNQAGVYSVMQGICQHKNEEILGVAAFFNHEEIGSQSAAGAASHILKESITRILLGLGFEVEDVIRLLPEGRFLSVDGAHGRHPAHADKGDPYHYALLNQGIVIKETGKQTYLTDVKAIGEMVDLLEKEEIPYQRLANHSDIRGGSTLGNIVAPSLMCPGLDMGISLLGMHAARELAGKEDIIYLVKGLCAYYNYYKN